MHGLRALIYAKRRAAILAVALALCMKALLPSGYMVSNPNELTIAICNGSGSDMTVKVEIPGKGSPSHGAAHDKLDGHCPYSSLSMAAMGGASAPLLALALVFVLALGLAPAMRRPFGRVHYLRPPLRGPPLRS